MKVLITGAKTSTALKLIRAFNGDEIILGDYGEMPTIGTSSYAFAELGTWNADVLAHNLLTKCLDNGVDTVLPLYEAEIVALSKSLVLFDEFGLKVLLPAQIQLHSQKFKDWCIFDSGKLIYASAAIELNAAITLNGAYTFDAETKDLALMSIANPL